MPVGPQARPAVGYAPPTTGWQHPGHMTAAAAGASAPVSGTVYLMPFDTGPTSRAYQALGCGVSTAQVGGTTTTTLGIYPDDGTSGAPRLTGGPLYSGTVTLTATGNRTASVAMLPPPGRWWGAFLYVQTAAPTTAPLLLCISGCVSLWTPTTIGTVVRALTVTGQSALPTTAQTFVAMTGSTAPVVSLQAT